MASDREPQPTVGRGAFFFGIFLGGAIAVAGFYAIQSFSPGGVVSIGMEIGIVLIALQVTTWIWRRSTARELDRLDRQKDRGEK